MQTRRRRRAAQGDGGAPAAKKKKRTTGSANKRKQGKAAKKDDGGDTKVAPMEQEEAKEIVKTDTQFMSNSFIVAGDLILPPNVKRRDFLGGNYEQHRLMGDDPLESINRLRARNWSFNKLVIIKAGDLSDELMKWAKENGIRIVDEETVFKKKGLEFEPWFVPEKDAEREAFLLANPNWVEIEAKVLPRYDPDLCSPYATKFSINYIEKYANECWKGVLKVTCNSLAEQAMSVMESASFMWFGGLSNLVFEYIGDNEEWSFLDRCVLYVDVNRLEYLLRTQDMITHYRAQHIIDIVHSSRPHFPKTAPEFRKYRRPVPPRFGLSLQKPAKPLKAALTRGVSEIKKMIRRTVSDGWETHRDVKDLDTELGEVLKSKLHHYQKRTLMWARSLEAEVRSGVKYRLPGDMLKVTPNYESSPVVFDWWNRRISLDTDPKIKENTLTFKGGVIANEMGLGKTLTTLTMIVLDMPRKKTKNIEAKMVEGRVHTNATLVVCPSHLAKQWKDDLEKHVSDAIDTPTVHLCTTLAQLRKLNYEKVMAADIVVASVQLFLNDNYHTRLLRGKEDRAKALDEHAKAQRPIVLGAFYWKRFVLDEGHELFSTAMAQNKTSVIDALVCIKSQTKWFLSGTPFPDELLSPRGALRFLEVAIGGEKLMEAEMFDDKAMVAKIGEGLKPEDDKDTILHTRIGSFLDKVLFSRMFCRYTKATVTDAYEVPDYVTEIVKLSMHPIERLLYELAVDDTKGLDDDRLRQLCAHPIVPDKEGSVIWSRVSFPTLKECLDKWHLSKHNQQDWLERRISGAREDNRNSNDDIANGRFLHRYRGQGRGPRIALTEQELRRERKRILKRERLIIKCQAELEELEPELGRLTEMRMLSMDGEVRNAQKTELRAAKAKARMEQFIGVRIQRGHFRKLRKEQKEHGFGDLSEDEQKEKLLAAHKRIIAQDARPSSLLFRPGRGKWYGEDDNFSDEEDYGVPSNYDSERDELPEVKPFMHNSIVSEYGSKIGYCISRVLEMLKDDSTRVILFSQWFRLFEFCKKAFDDYGIKYVLCKGNVHMRTNAMKKFNTDMHTRVIMLSLESAASGANLQKASHVILLDPCAGTKEEADAIEAQAIGRAHRQGQDKKLTVIRMVMKGTIEEELLNRTEETSSWRVEAQ